MTTHILPRNAEKSKVSYLNFRYPRRVPNDFYPTPPEAVRALLSVESFEGSIWEPAC